jgi:ribosomal protein L21E
MGHPAGLRAGTRYAFSRNFREKGMIRLSTYLKQYKYVGAFGREVGCSVANWK